MNIKLNKKYITHNIMMHNIQLQILVQLCIENNNINTIN